ncbi:hypothetical protein ACQP00_26175 [Dactylosporangium sp. CS-047395]|uniref:hypothetical protein n=1 Tax=Dactylosporangium sp. CS-047395 TaxID=3239936 RepID=UPI003D8A4514
MPELVGALDTTVLVDHGTFDLLDDGGPQHPAADGLGPARWLGTGANAVTVYSPAAWSHVGGLRLEVWDGPPPPEDTWADRQEGAARFDSGLVEVNPLVDGGEDEESLEVEPGAYGVRAYVAGRAELLAIQDEPDADLDGIERYLVQLWPV